MYQGLSEGEDRLYYGSRYNAYKSLQIHQQKANAGPD